MARILVIDDEPQIRRFLRISLAANGYEVVDSETARAGIELAKAGDTDLVILDLGLHDLDGQEAITAIRAARQELPILVLSVRAQEVDKVEALDRGANDYVVKPFGVAELLARVRAALRRPSEKGGAEIVVTGPLRMDFTRHVVTRQGEELHLSKREFALLRYLAGNPDHVLTHKEILRAVWGPAHTEDTAYLRVYVNQLRQKLEEDPAAPRLILTEPGVGYRLRVEAK